MKKFIYLFFFVILSFEVLFVFAQKKDSTVFEKNNNQKLTKQQKEAMNLALLNARKYIANHQWDEAEDSYKLALKYDSTNLNNYLEFVSYLKERNGYRGILSLSEKLLPVYKKQAANDRFMQKGSAIILEFMGESHFSRGDTNQAKKEFKEALEILQNAEKKNPPATSSVNAILCQSLAYCFNAQSRYTLAEKYFLAMIKAYNEEVQDTEVLFIANCDISNVLASPGIPCRMQCPLHRMPIMSCSVTSFMPTIVPESSLHIC